MYLRNQLFKSGLIGLTGNSSSNHLNHNLIFTFDSLARKFSTVSNRNKYSSNQPNHKKRQYPKSISKFKVQANKWLEKVDEVKKVNEPKEELENLKTQYNITEDNQYEILNKELVPLSLIDYQTQLKIKKRRLELFLNQFVSSITNFKSTIILDSEKHPCVLNDVVESKYKEEYRSQDNFIINLDVNKSIAVGLAIGKFNTGLTIIRPTNFLICKKSHRHLAEKFEAYLREKSQLKCILDYKSRRGNWTDFFVRSNRNGEHQCLAILNDQKLTNEMIEEESSLLREYFGAISSEFKIKSFDLELINTKKKIEERFPANDLKQNTLNQIEPMVKDRSRLVNIFGNDCLSFEFNNGTYSVPVKSLLPLNLEVYEKLIHLLIENMDLVRRQNLIFVNPFGAFGLPDLAKLVNNLFVIYQNEQNLNDCKMSLKNFDVKNINFSHGNTLKSLFKILDNNRQEIAAIIKQEDLTPQIIGELRENRRVSKIAVIATKPKESLLRNWVQLCLDNVSDLSIGNPFSFISSTPLDTHPHSNIYTILSVFERIIN